MKVVWKVTLVSILVMIGILCGNNSFAEDTTCAISWTWDTTGDLEKSIIVQTNAATTIDWGDESTESVAASSSDLTLSHTYTSSGDYTCKISNNVVTKLDCSSNQISSIDVSRCTRLRYLYCYDNQISSIDVSNNTRLESLNCSSNQISSIDVSGCTSLRALYCNSNQISSIDVRNNTSLYELNCSSNQISSINLSNNTRLESLYCHNNQISSIDVSNNTSLKYLDCNSNQISRINVSGCTHLWRLDCNSNQISRIDVSGCTSLYILRCYDNQISSLDLSDCTQLWSLYCYSNNLSSIDVSSCTSLDDLYCGNNQLTALDVTANTSIRRICCVQPTLNVISLTQDQYGYTYREKEFCEFVTSINEYAPKYINFHIGYNTKISVDGVIQCTGHTGGTHSNGGICTYCGAVYQTHGQSTTVSSYTTTATQHTPIYACSYSGCTSTYTGTEENHGGALPVNGGKCTTCNYQYQTYNTLWSWNTTDQLTKSVTLTTTGATVVYWGDGTSTSITEAKTGYELSHTYTDAGNYTVGISENVLKGLKIEAQKLNALDVSQNVLLEVLECDNNELTTLTLASNVKLYNLNCSNNQISELDVSRSADLEIFNCANNELSQLNISQNSVLKTLNCGGNELTNIDVSNNSILTNLNCSDNSIATLNVNRNSALATLYCQGNVITALDVSNNPQLTDLYCSGNQLTVLDMTSNKKLNKLCCVQTTLNTLKLNDDQLEVMNILSEANGCSNITTNLTIHKSASTNVDVVGFVLKIQPNAVTLGDLKYTTAFSKAKNMLNDNTYGISNDATTVLLDSHLMKNSEWSAVVYLANGIGKNPYKNVSQYFSGVSGSTENGVNSTAQYAWNTANGMKASTTHNVYGIYDLNGGKQEFVGAYIVNRNVDDLVADSVQIKNVDKYSELSDTMNYKGAALSETGNFTEGKSWNGSSMTDGSETYLVRGGYYDTTYVGDMFMMSTADSSGDANNGFRTVIVVKRSDLDE